MLSTAETEALERALGAQIAHTGANETRLVSAGLVTLAVGAALAILAVVRRRSA